MTKGSNGIAMATLPNVCKMPGPPPPFVATPLPNIGKSGDSPKGYSKKVKVEGQFVAIKGASFGSVGDAASKGTGGGLVSVNTHGPTKFIGPGSFDVKIEGKNVQYLGDPMMNNCGPSGSPANSATLNGVMQAFIDMVDDWIQPLVNECDEKVNSTWDAQNPPGKRHGDCWALTGEIGSDKQPVTVQQKLGSVKEDCVYSKMRAREGLPEERDEQFAGHRAIIQKRFYPNGAPCKSKKRSDWLGTIVPDIVMTGPDGAVIAVRDLKFPCPSEQKKPGKWSPDQDDMYFDAFGVVPELIFPKK
ncbi:DUF4150 domain-containing protein [Myxococcota bacterium]|nr:DUF4150 domain-containing protein [Myxococcota bacterium]